MPKKTQPKQQLSEQPHFGPLLIVLVVLLLLLMGGLYLWWLVQSSVSIEVEEPFTRPTAEENNEPESTNAEAAVETLNALSPSDTLEAIEADLDGTIFDDLEDDFSTIEAELGREKSQPEDL